MSSFVESICKIGIFIIAAQAVIHFAPTAKYEKYMKLVVGIIVLLQFLAPINKITDGIENGWDTEDGWRTRFTDMEAELEGDFSVGEESLFSEKIVAEMEKEIKSRLNNNLEEENYNILKVNVELASSDRENEQGYVQYNDENNGSYGNYQLNTIQVYVMAHNDENGGIDYGSYEDGGAESNGIEDGVHSSSVVKVEEIHINKVGENENGVNTDEERQSVSKAGAELEGERQKESGRLRKKFAGLLGVGEEYMEVSIYGWAE